MNNTNDTSFIHTFTLLILGLTVTGLLAFVLAQFVANKAKENEVISQNTIERIQAVGRQNTTGKQISITSVAGLVPDSMESTSNATISNQPLIITEEPNLEAVASTNISKTGKQVYEAACAVCHSAGVAGAPKFGDSSAWKLRVTKGEEKLYANAINGYIGNAGVMPAKGGRPDLSDIEVKNAVDYMTDSSL